MKKTTKDLFKVIIIVFMFFCSVSSFLHNFLRGKEEEAPVFISEKPKSELILEERSPESVIEMLSNKKNDFLLVSNDFGGTITATPYIHDWCQIEQDISSVSTKTFQRIF